jgi:hypothetical protein
MTDNSDLKNAKTFFCEKCNFTCNKLSNWNKHILTRKHNNTYKILTSVEEKMPKNAASYECECGRSYKHRQSLHTHKKSCSITQGTYKNTVIENDKSIDKELLIKMLLKNQDVMEKMIEMMPNIGNNSHNNITNNTTNNNQFNINMFLNEQCKNAMNLTDFIQSLPVTAETFDNTIENGLTKSITTMITNGLNNMDVLERPIHCTDVNRKTLYVKDNDTWEKDNELKSLLHGIKELSIKQRTSISKWHDANEGWETDSNLQTKLSSLVFHTMEDIENNEKEVNKIIRAIGKNTYLNNEVKEQYK